MINQLQSIKTKFDDKFSEMSLCSRIDIFICPITFILFVNVISTVVVFHLPGMFFSLCCVYFNIIQLKKK